MTLFPAKTRRAAQARLRDLGVHMPSLSSVDELCRVLSSARDREIRIYGIEWPTGVDASGIWLEAKDVDYVCVDHSLPAPLYDHVVLHELCHILCNHEGTPVTDRMVRNGRLSPSTVERMLQRTLYDNDEEREAELLASEISSRIHGDRPLAGPDDDRTRQIVHGIADVMGDGRQ